MRFISRRETLLLIYLALFASPAAAMEDGRDIAAVSLAAKQQNALPPAPWLSEMRVTENDSDSIYLADGKRLMRRPNLVSSYNEELHDVSEFYKPDSMQVNFMMHYAGRTAGEIISLGVDSGYRAKKITAQPALFIGYARSLSIGRSNYVTFAAGGWFGGKVSHKPCRDETQRKFYCGNAKAWSDFQPQQQTLQHYYQLVFTHEF